MGAGEGPLCRHPKSFGRSACEMAPAGGAAVIKVGAATEKRMRAGLAQASLSIAVARAGRMVTKEQILERIGNSFASVPRNARSCGVFRVGERCFSL